MKRALQLVLWMVWAAVLGGCGGLLTSDQPADHVYWLDAVTLEFGEAPNPHQPDLVVADIMMPFVSGLELINYIRKDLGSLLPVIIISALEHDETVLEAFRLGASDFITKPFKPNELILRIKKIFQEIELSQA